MGEAETGEDGRGEGKEVLVGELRLGKSLKPRRGGKKYRRLVGEAETGEESKASRGEEERSTGD